jgi:hypothetical protein
LTTVPSTKTMFDARMQASSTQRFRASMRRGYFGSPRLRRIKNSGNEGVCS